MKQRSQSEHAIINATSWPGTRQICEECGRPTGRCEEDTIQNSDGDPVCEDCAS